MDNVNLSSEALLSNQGDMTSFRYDIVISDFVLQNASNDTQRLRNGIMDILLSWPTTKVWEKPKSTLIFCPY